MKISTIREFRNHTTRLTQNEEPLLVTRRGKVAGIFIPWTESTLPTDVKRELFLAITQDIARQLKKANVSEEEVLEDFANWRKKRRAVGRGR